MFVDTHCHIFSSYYNDIDKVIKRAKFNLVTYYINNGSDYESNKEVLKLIDNYDSMYGALGIHPEEVEKYTPNDIEFIRSNLNHKKIVAIGEIGLDYHYTKDNKEKQIELLRNQLKIAEEFDLPVIIHSREATEDTINVLKDYSVKGVIHSFSGSLETARIYIKMGYLLGINGVVTFKNSKLKNIIKEVGLENIVLETDSPYLTPEPYRGKTNGPKHIFDIALYLAHLFNVSLEDVAKITNSNVKKMYKKMIID